MSTQDYDSQFLTQMSEAAKRRNCVAPPLASEVADVTDPTRPIRAKQANLCDAVMMRVVELEREAASLTEIAKKLRAAVLANT